MMARFNRIGGDADARRWQDWINLVLAVWLFVSPWVLGFAVGTAAMAGAAPIFNAAWDAWIFGVITAVVAISAISRLAAWQEWISLAIGLWLFIAPWALGFSAARTAAWDHWFVGLLIVLASLSTLSVRRRLMADYSHAGDKPRDRP